MNYSILKKLLFSIDPERAHNLAMWAISTGLVGSDTLASPLLRTSIFGKTIPHPLGLAAGFDKNAVALDHWESLGFSFVEVGTVTPLPQSGNPKPRLFRLNDDRALINRMGFNNDGVIAIANRLEARQTRIPIGVNIGKNKWTPNQHAMEDYATCMRAVHDLCDYVVVNVSSPNTPGLRDLQSADTIMRIVDKLVSISTRTPILVKISPDSHDEELAETAIRAVESGASGIVATNTTVSRAGLSTVPQEDGGLSGAPLASRAAIVCRLVRQTIGPDPIIIGVGGIDSGLAARERINSGANLLQVYTSFVYRGPNAASEIVGELQGLLSPSGQAA